MMKMKLQYLLLVVTGIGLEILACQPKNDPAPSPSPSPFLITAKIVLGVADLKPNHLVNDINLTWTTDKAQVSDSITYTIFCKDTLAKNLTDTTFTINNVGENVTITGLVIATTNKGRTSSNPFSVTTGLAPRFRIKKWTVSSSAARYYDYTTYSYDSLGRLASFNSFEGKVCCFVRGQTSVLKYDKVGRLISVEGLPNGDNTGQFEIYLHTFEYDEKDRLSVQKFYYTTYQKLPLEYRREARYEFNDMGLITKAGSTDYTYKNGNLVQQIIYNFDSQGNKKVFDYQYDTSPNPFYGLWCYSDFSDPVVTFSKNYRLGSKVTAVYDSNGLIIERYDRSQIDRQEFFEYESY